MKYFVLVATIIVSTTGFAQVNNAAPPLKPSTSINAQEPDTAFRVIYVKKTKAHQQPLYIINGQASTSSVLFSMDPNMINDIQVLRGDTTVDKVTYSGRVIIETRQGIAPKYISLTQLKDKYTNLKGKTVVFTLDGNFINADYDKYVIDEAGLLTIVVDALQATKANSELGLIKLLSRSKQNIEDRKKIMIRGADLSMNE
jgi:hypothetical protein